MNLTKGLSTKISLRDLHSLRSDVMAEKIFHLQEEEDIDSLLQFSNTDLFHLYILGEGSNTLFVHDQKRLILLNRLKGRKILQEEASYVDIEAAAGENWNSIVEWSVSQGFYGLENLVAIPGSAGAAPVQNIGAYGKEVAQFIRSVEVLDLASGQRHEIPVEECGFAYRDSSFKSVWKQRYLILKIQLRLFKEPTVDIRYPDLKQYFAGESPERLGVQSHSIKAKQRNIDPSPREVMHAVAEIRAAKIPSLQSFPNAGSFFKNPIIDSEKLETLLIQYPDLPSFKLESSLGDNYKVPAAWLIEKAGWKGKELRGVKMWDQHALILGHTGDARGEDLWFYAQQVMQSVEELFAIRLEPEVNILF